MVLTRKNEYFLCELKTSKKRQIIFLIVSMAVLFVGYNFMMNAIKRDKAEEAIIRHEITTDYKFLFDFEYIETEESNFFIEGWVMKLGARNIEVHILLQPDTVHDKMVLSTDMYTRNDIEEIFEPEHEHGECGFSAEIKSNKLETDVCYQVYLVLDYEAECEKRLKINTDKYIYNGKLYNYDPNKFEKPNISDDELLRVMNDGKVRAYDMEKKIWIYQYDDMLYYIVNPEFGSMKDNDIKILVMPDTSRVYLLPEKRISNGFDHLGAYYEDLLYAREGIMPYQVVKVTLSSAYPNTYISTGMYHLDSETWYRHFRFSIVDWSVEKFLAEQ